MHGWSWTVIECCWGAWALLWVVMAFSAKRTVDRPRGAWGLTTGIAAGTWLLIFGELACWGVPTNTTAGVGSTLEKRKALVKEACDSQTYSELLRLNAMDLKLVDLARAEVERRFRCVPVS